MKAFRIIGRCMLAVAIAASMLGISAVAQPVQQAHAYDDGVYQIKAQIVHASQAGQASMAQAAFDNVLEPGTAKKVTDAYTKAYASNSKKGKKTELPWYTLTLVVKDGTAYLESRMIPIDRNLGSSSFTGYLGYLDYYPSYHGKTSPLGEESTAAIADSYYSKGRNLSKGYDSYNKPKTGTDAALRGQKYPQDVSMQIDSAQSELWIQVYVPVMESISKGSGSQFAKIKLDYSSMQRVADEGQVATAEGIADRHASAVQNGYQDLANDITIASKRLLDKDVYTSASLKSLRAARDSAQRLYEARSATSFSVMRAIMNLNIAEQQLVKKSSASGGKSGKSGGSSGSKRHGSSSGSRPSSSSGTGSKSLNFANLKNGTYTVYGEMIKTDRRQQSMSNAAIDHNIRIRVKNGKYTVRMTFSVLHYSGKTGALGKLWYFKSGYKHPNGTLSGSRSRAKTLSLLTTSSGAKFKDEYGTNYPKTVSFPLIPEAKSDGWVPLQVFVPVMEGISAGTGTQGVYLRLHTGSVVSGAKKVAGSSTGVSAREGGTSGTSAGASGSNAGGASGDNGTDVSGLLAGGASGDGSGNGSTTGGGLTDDGDATNGDGSGSGESQQGTSAQSGQQQAPATQAAANEPPLKRYIGLIAGIPLLIICLCCIYALFRRRGQIRAQLHEFAGGRS